MPSYYIKDKDGFEIELNGESPPTEKDIDQILGAQKIKNAKKVWQAQEFEKTIPGKILGFPGALLGQRKTSEMLQRGQALKGMPFGQRLKETALDVGRDVARAAPMLVGGPVGGTAMKVGSALGRRAITPLMRDMAVTGISKVAEEGLEGASAKDALLAGGGAAGTVGAFGKGLPLIGKGLHMAGKGIGLGIKEVGHMLSGPATDEVVEGIIKYPEVLTNTIPTINEAGKKALTLIDDRVKREGATLEKGIGEMLKTLPDNAIADLSGSQKLLGHDLMRRIREVFKYDQIPVGLQEEGMLEAIEKGGYLTIPQARKINSMLGEISRRNPSTSFPKAAIDKVTALKKFILDSASNPKTIEQRGGYVGYYPKFTPLKIPLPEKVRLNKLNQKFAKVKEDADHVRKQLADIDSKTGLPRIKESEAAALGAEGLGKSKNKAEKMID